MTKILGGNKKWMVNFIHQIQFQNDPNPFLALLQFLSGGWDGFAKQELCKYFNALRKKLKLELSVFKKGSQGSTTPQARGERGETL